jgi:hypothetical protein
MMAVGVDASRYLPGLYWFNFFGAPYRVLLGAERLLELPAHAVESVDDGVLVLLSARPDAWKTDEYKEAEARVLRQLGEKYFFDPSDPHRNTVGAAFGLKILPRHPRFT